MNKAELKELYGIYCDTDKLVDDIMALLTKYRYNNTEHGVCTMLSVFFENKMELIELFKRSDNYIGELRIMFDVELERDNGSNDVYRFCTSFVDRVGAKKAILQYKDADGKTLSDYLRTGISTLTVRDLMNDDIKRKLSKSSELQNRFVKSTGVTVKSDAKLKTFADAIHGFALHNHSELGENMVETLAQYEINQKFAPTMKTSRAFNRMCSYFGVDKLPLYNKLFAQYADMVSGLKRQMKFYISLNPLDYLTMSFGHSWASCHTIDKTNRRGMQNHYSGVYCGGTLSYMLDKTSFVTFVHNSVPEDIVEEGKIYRNMFHYGKNMLVQGRVYPQGNDGNTDLYKVFRGFVQKELSALLGINNTWVKSSTRPNSVVSSSGAHYQDYNNFCSCNVSHPKENPLSGEAIEIGHVGMCPHCGDEHRQCSSLNCNSCN